MRYLNATEKKNIMGRLQEMSPIVKKKNYANVENPLEVIDITNDTISIQTDFEVSGEWGSTTRSVGNLTVSNVDNNLGDIDPQGKYSNFIVDDEVSVYVNAGGDDIPLFKGRIISANARENNTAMQFQLLSQRELDLEVTNSTILENKKPWELCQFIVENYLNATFSLQQVSSTDETNKNILYTSYFKDKAFDELKQLTDYAESILYYNPLNNNYTYVTREKLKELKETVDTDSDLTVGTSADYSVLTYNIGHMTDITSKRARETFYNDIQGVYNSYEKKTSTVQPFVVYSIRQKLEPGVTTLVEKKFSSGEYFTGITGKLNDVSLFDDYSGDDHTTSGWVDSSLTYYPNGMSGYIKNLHSAPIWIEFQVISNTAYIPNTNEKNLKDTTSIQLNGRKEYRFQNKYCQSFSGLHDYMSSRIFYFNGGEREADVTISGHPAIELLDKVRVIGGLSSNFDSNTLFGLVKKIEHRMDGNKGYQTIITLFHVTYNQSI